MLPEKKSCRECKVSFLIGESDKSFYQKMGVPFPVLCPACRFQRRAVFRNEMMLYKRTCGLCGKRILSMYHDTSPYSVYCQDCWQSDKWDPSSYAQDYDPSKNFFDQLKELTVRVPKAGTFISNDLGANINSEYTNFAGSNKDCYLCFNASPNNENCAYCRGIGKSRDTFDSYFCDEVEQIYEGMNIQKSRGVLWADNVSDSMDSAFLLGCVGCNSCFGCVNLRHKSYHFLNEPLSKEEYKKRVKDIMGSYEKIEKFKKQFAEFAQKFPRRATQNLRSINVTGNYIFDSKDCMNSFEISGSENVQHSFSVKLAKDSYDILGHGRKTELVLEGVAVGTSSRVLSSWWTVTSHNVEYSLGLRGSNNCFGCDSLRNAEFSILNKKYDEKTYREIRAKIVAELCDQGEYGLYFPPSLALFAYNETVGQDILPLTKVEAITRGFDWRENLPMTMDQETIQSKDIPDHIKDVSDSILKETMACLECKRNYRFIAPELTFYRANNIPLPRQCFFCRHADRIRRRGPFILIDRVCSKCAKEIKTNLTSEKFKTVYCDSCYQQEVI